MGTDTSTALAGLSATQDNFLARLARPGDAPDAATAMQMAVS